MAFGVLGFPLVVLAAKSNVPLAAVPVINTNVHFCAAVLTEKQAGQRVDFPVPVGASDGCVFQNPLYGFKIAAADNRLMHIFCDVPLAPVYIVVMFIPEMLCSLEVDYIAAIALLSGDGAGIYKDEGFFADLKKLHNVGWNVEVYAWDETCHRGMKDFAEQNWNFTNLTDSYYHITFLQGVRPAI